MQTEQPNLELAIAKRRIVEMEQQLLAQEQELAKMKQTVSEVLSATVIKEALDILSANSYVAVIQEHRVLLFHVRKITPALDNRGVRVYYHTLVKYSKDKSGMNYSKTVANTKLTEGLGNNTADAILNAYNYTLLVQDDMEVLPITEEGFADLDHEQKLKEIWEQVRGYFNSTEKKD